MLTVMTDDAIPAEAQELHVQGRAAGSAGDTALALELFHRAHMLAPSWPYPPYDMAFTYLLADDLDQASQWYAHVDRLAPRGFFTAKTALDTIRREMRGELFEGFSKQFALLEFESDETKLEALGHITQRFPEFAPGWEKLVSLLDDDDERLRAIDHGLAGNPDDDTYGSLVINKALVTSRRGDRVGAKRSLEQLLVDTRCTIGAEALANMTLSSL
jgi:hypothetical protein